MGRPDLNIQMLSNLDQDWAEAVEWLGGSTWTTEQLEEFTNLFACDVKSIRETKAVYIDCLQRLARVAFWESWKRLLDRAALDAEGD